MLVDMYAFLGFGITDVCEDTHEWCGANPGWPPSSCNHADWGSQIQQHCPAMCSICTAGISLYSVLLGGYFATNRKKCRGRVPT